MYLNRSYKGGEVLKLALEIRKRFNIDLKNSFCVFDFAEKIGIEVKFVDIPSMEGLYIQKPRRTILITSHRPLGRQRFTCAHELGHYFFKHRGIHIDDIIEYYNKPVKKGLKEKSADLFASYFLMPSTTVINGFVRRGWNIQNATPIQIYTVACWLGVGYSTLINHLQFGLKKLTNTQADWLLKKSPKEIKKDLFGAYLQENLIPVDIGWTGRPIDIHNNDFLISEEKIDIDGSNLGCVNNKSGRYIYKASKTGICRITSYEKNWSSFVRVSRRNYVGRCKYRHLEENDND